METATVKSREAAASVVQPGKASMGKRILKALLFCMGLVVILAVVGAGIGYAKLNAVRSTEPYRKALAQIQKDPQVIRQLGEPVQDVSWFPGGVIEQESGMANLNFAIAGPKGRAHVTTQARCFSGDWGLVTLDVIFPNGERQSIDTSDPNSSNDAPKWSPGK